MKWYRCVKTNRITQRWGTKGAWYRANGINIKGHNGYDLKCKYGETVHHSAMFSGYVKTYVDSKGGIGIDIINTTIGVKARYWHLKKVLVLNGRRVNPGDPIGFGDSTGFSTGDHVHYAKKLVDRYGRTKNRRNGYAGAIDFTPDFENKFILDVVGKEKVEQRLKLRLLILNLKLQIALLLKSRR